MVVQFVEYIHLYYKKFIEYKQRFLEAFPNGIEGFELRKLTLLDGRDCRRIKA